MSNTSPKEYAINYGSGDASADNLSFINMLYKNVLDRVADADGVNYWLGLLNSHSITRDQLISDIFNSAELQNQFSSPAEIVTNVYRSLLLRDPDRSGLDFWTGALASGGIHAGDVAIAIAHSPEFAKIQSTSGQLPIIDTLWEDQASWDSITAEQVARLIAYNPTGDGKTYPNAGLDFIVSGLGPNSAAKLSSNSHAYNYTDAHENYIEVSVANKIFMDESAGKHPSAPDPQYFVSFIKAISDEVSRLTDGKVKWATQDPNSTGSVGYHPDTTTADYGSDWASYTIPNGSTFPNASDVADSYKAYVDYTAYLNAALKDSGLKGISQIIYETEGAYLPPASSLPPGASREQALFTEILDYAKQNPDWQGSGAQSEIALAATSASVVNMSYWGAAQWYAQVYDLLNDNKSYPFTTWTAPTNIDPSITSTNSPTAIAADFANFFANNAVKESTSSIPDAIFNARYMLNNLDDDASSTGFNPNANFIFSYGPGGSPDETVNQPIFQYGQYIFTSDVNHNLIPSPYTKVAQTNTYYWDASDFANFASNFGPDLSANLNKVIGSTFQTNGTPPIGLWGAERALDAWFGYVDMPSQPAWISDVKSISDGAKVSLSDYIDHAYQALVGRIPTSNEANALMTVATTTLNPATQDHVTLTAEAAIINYLINTSSADYTSIDSAEFVNHLYNDILGRSPDLPGAQFFVSELAKGASRSAIIQSVLNSDEFSTASGFDFKDATFASRVQYLWQDNVQSWLSTSQQQAAVQQLSKLMAGNPNFSLILDFDPEFSPNSNWNSTNLINFMTLLNDAHLTPHIYYHPDATSKDGSQWFQNGGTDYINQMATWMASLNSAISKTTLPSSFLLQGFVGEGDLLPKVAQTYTTFAQDYQQAASALGLPTTTELWYTGDWHTDNTLSTSPSQITGDFVQLYDFWPGNSLLNLLPKNAIGYPATDPGMATLIGKQLLQSLLGQADHPLNPQLLQNPSATVWTLNFTGSSTGSNSDAPVFGAGSDVTAPWDVNDTNQLLSALISEAAQLYGQNGGGPVTPQIAIWGIDYALDSLTAVSTLGTGPAASL